MKSRSLEEIRRADQLTIGELYGEMQLKITAFVRDGEFVHQLPEQLAADRHVLLQHVPTWQPIETAPKEGSMLVHWLVDGTMNLITVSHASFLNDSDDATHWMPLPEPPKP